MNSLHLNPSPTSSNAPTISPSPNINLNINPSANTNPRPTSTQKTKSPQKQTKNKANEINNAVKDEMIGVMSQRIEMNDKARQNFMQIAAIRASHSNNGSDSKATNMSKSLQINNGETSSNDTMGALSSSNQSQIPSNNSKFPTSSKCHGDFCMTSIRDSDELNESTSISNSSSKNVLNEQFISNNYAYVKSMQSASNDGNSGGDILKASTNPQSSKTYNSIPYTSIYKARLELELAEKQYKSKSGEGDAAWSDYPVDRKQKGKMYGLDEKYWKIVNPNTDADADAAIAKVEEELLAAKIEKEKQNQTKKRGKDDLHKQTKASIAKNILKSSLLLGDIPIVGGVNNFYRQVKVCGGCMKCYMLLDQARELMLSDDDVNLQRKRESGRSDSDGTKIGIKKLNARTRAAQAREERNMDKARGAASDSFEESGGLDNAPFNNSSIFDSTVDDSFALSDNNSVDGDDDGGMLFSPSQRGMKGILNASRSSNNRPLTSSTFMNPKSRSFVNQKIDFNSKSNSNSKTKVKSRPMTSPMGKPTGFQPDISTTDSDVFFADSEDPRWRGNTTSTNANSIPNKANIHMQNTAPLPRAPTKPRATSKPTNEDGPIEAFGGKFNKLEKFLRGTGAGYGNKNTRRAAELKDGGTGGLHDTSSSSFVDIDGLNKKFDANVYHARILLAMNDTAEAEPIAQDLESQGYLVAFEQDGIKVLDILTEGDYDCLIVQNDLFVKNAMDITAFIRDVERSKRKALTLVMARDAKNRSSAPLLRDEEKKKENAKARVRKAEATTFSKIKTLPVVVYTEKVAKDDLKSYMEAGMDGCLSRPYDREALITTLRQAIPRHLQPLPSSHTEKPPSQPQKLNKTFTLNSQPQGNSSADMIAKTLAMSSSFTNNEGCINDVLQLDIDTVFPYTVMDSSIDSTGIKGVKKHKRDTPSPYFNLIVVHDIFDTCERMKIFLRPITERYPGLQILVWNYPGQAFTEYREEQLLNNEYHAKCLDSLIEHVGPTGTNQFDTTKPFHLLGYGNGGNIASFYSAFYRNTSLRALILMNSFSYVDPHMASVLHDCMNVFSSSPPNRPDLPIYFFARFLFCPAYLSSVSTPLALNLYTAVHNPIALNGRIQLCLGALSHVDLRKVLSDIPVPIINMQSTKDALVKPMHTDPYVNMREGGGGGAEVKSIHRCFQAHLHNAKARKTCLVWINSGHEIMQEKRTQVLQFIEQLVIGYHEVGDVAFMPSMSVDREVVVGMEMKGGGSVRSGGTSVKTPLSVRNGNGNSSGKGEQFEDRFIDGVIGKLGNLTSKRGVTSGNANTDGNDKENKGRLSSETIMEMENSRWNQFASSTAAAHASYSYDAGDHVSGGSYNKRRGNTSQSHTRSRNTHTRETASRTVTDPTKASFGQDRKSGDKTLYDDHENYAEVQEYMGWRLKRNKTRLSRLDAASRVIQSSYRAHLAWQVISELRRKRAIVYIQRCYRGWKGRLVFLERMRIVWATQVVQRNWRGHAGREHYLSSRIQSACVCNIQRVWRGFLGKKCVRGIKRAMHKGACSLQNSWRKRVAKRAAFKLRLLKNAAVILQRIYRGHLGRRKGGVERDKYLFSKSQAQGIQFGKQMLLEHKLHATKLQSEVSVLTQEKVGTEEDIESMLEEISEFEEGVRTLEKEMHQLSKIQTEANGVLDEEAKLELRDQKIRLDKEFSQMLTNIKDRKDKLKKYEEAMMKLDRARQEKEEELRMLERKLVVLLEEQQQELIAIKRRQERRGENLLKGETEGGGGGKEGDGNAISSVGYSGPSDKDKKAAAQLMQSTETLMKFGFMSMSMTYFSSLNMVKAMRTVAATDTVMAAVHDTTTKNEAARTAAIGSGVGGGGGGGDQSFGGNGAYKPDLKPGHRPGQSQLHVASWSVEDVGRWLQAIALGQYRTAFLDAAVDGAFLFDIDDDDLKNTLGVEHRLHRKKVLNTIVRLKEGESIRANELRSRTQYENNPPPGFNGPNLGYPKGPIGPAGVMGFVAPPGSSIISMMQSDAAASASIASEANTGVDLNIKKMESWVRHHKQKMLSKALEQLSAKKFDSGLIKVQFVEGYGTQYADGYDNGSFNLNQTLDQGNTLLHVAAQNGAYKIAKLLQRYGANVNHQNVFGQTPGHYALAYTFYDFGNWLFDPEQGGADDTLVNMYGLGPYDGLDDGLDQESVSTMDVSMLEIG